MKYDLYIAANVCVQHGHRSCYVKVILVQEKILHNLFPFFSNNALES